MKNTGDFTKIVEKASTPLGNLLVRKDPWGDSGCGKEQCRVCGGVEEKARCRARGVTYSNTCQLCKAQGRDSVYIGETSKTLAERAENHYDDLRRPKQQARSHMWMHNMEEHEGAGSFKFKVLGVHHRAMERQITEAIQIKLATKAGTKAEYN